MFQMNDIKGLSIVRTRFIVRSLAKQSSRAYVDGAFSWHAVLGKPICTLMRMSQYLDVSTMSYV